MLKTGRPVDPESLRSCVVCGCNFPPSQFQLHIQYFLMPWLPCQYRPFLDGNQLVQGRWFPLEYIKRVLSLDDPMPVRRRWRTRTPSGRTPSRRCRLAHALCRVPSAVWPRTDAAEGRCTASSRR